MELSGFFAYVTIEGNRAKPHGVEVSADKKTATCWIISEAGKVSPSLELENRTPIPPYRCPDILRALGGLHSISRDKWEGFCGWHKLSGLYDTCDRCRQAAQGVQNRQKVVLNNNKAFHLFCDGTDR